MHAGPDSDVGVGLVHLLCDGAGVHKVVLRGLTEDEAVLAVVDTHVHANVHGQAVAPGAVHDGVATHHGHLVQASGREACKTRVVPGTEPGNGARGEASLLLEALVLVAGLCGRLEVVVDVCASRAGNVGDGALFSLEGGRLCGRGHLAKVEELVGVDALVGEAVEWRHGHRRLDCGSHVVCLTLWRVAGGCLGSSFGRLADVLGVLYRGQCEPDRSG